MRPHQAGYWILWCVVALALTGCVLPLFDPGDITDAPIVEGLRALRDGVFEMCRLIGGGR